MYLVLEYMKRGDLIKFLKTRDAPEDRDSKESSKRKNSDHLITLSDAELKVIFTQVVSGVKYLHYQNIIHGDIKPQVGIAISLSPLTHFLPSFRISSSGMTI
jgi:serine/threonine protein kinase